MKTKKILKVGLLGYLLFWVAFSRPYLLAEEKVEYLQISKEDLMMLESNLTQLREQFQVQEKIHLSLTTHLESATKELMSAKQSLTELENRTNAEINRKMWVGIGIGAGVTVLVCLITGLAVGLTRK